MSDECEDLDCKNPKNCNKRHQKRCSNYDLGNLRFKSECAYKHLKPTKNQDHVELKVKVDALEKAGQDITKTDKDNEQLHAN